MTSTPQIAISGLGAVSSAGWGVPALISALDNGSPLPGSIAELPDGSSLPARKVPKPDERLPFLRQPRLRRSSRISHFATSAALEAIGTDEDNTELGIVFSVMNACVNYSSRFFAEALDEPSTASPILFPETVFNAPSSHLSSLFASTAPNDTLVGDAATFLAGLDLAAGWISRGEVDRCLVVAAEEFDPLSAAGLRLLEPGAVPSEGAAAVLLERSQSPAPLSLAQITSSHTFSSAAGRQPAAGASFAELLHQAPLPRTFSNTLPGAVDLTNFLGDSMGASAALQCVAALASLKNAPANTTIVHHTGANQQSIAAAFTCIP